MTTGTVDLSALVKDSMAKMTAMGGKEFPNAGVPIEHGPVVNDMAALLEVTSSMGVEQTQVPMTSFEKIPSPDM